MNNSTIVLMVAPHADDETLGCGGTILRYIKAGAKVHWLLVTGMLEEYGYSIEQIEKRDNEIKLAAEKYGFEKVHKLQHRPASLDCVPKGALIGAISDVVQDVQPTEVFTTYRNDAHSDHEAVYDAVMAATKSFRYPCVKKVFAYETLSETDFGMKPEDAGFRPNYFVNISDFLDEKLNILELFESEVADFPFPRSRVAIESLARLRGAQCNHLAAESFMLLKEIV